MTFWSDHLAIIYGVRTIRVYELIQDLPYMITLDIIIDYPQCQPKLAPHQKLTK